MTRIYTIYFLSLAMTLGATVGNTQGQGNPATTQNTEQPANTNAGQAAEWQAAMSDGSMTENREALVNLVGERRADAIIKAASPGMQVMLNKAAANIAANAASTGRATAKSANITTPTQTLDSTMTLYRSPGSENWVNDYKTLFSYNAQLLTTESLEYEWIGSQNNWAYESRMAYAYNNQGLATEILFFDESDAPEMKMELFYNAQGLTDSVYTYDPLEGSELVLVMIQHYLYEDGLVQEIGMSVYDEEEDEWFDDMVIRFEYDGQGRRTSMGTYFLMDEEDEEPMLYSMTEYTYTPGGQLASTTSSTLSFTTFQVEPSDKTEYTYNAAGDLTMSVDYQYIDGIWGEEYKDEYAYHPSLLFSDVANPFEVMMQLYYFVEAFPDYNRMVTEIKGFERVDGSWVEVDRTAFYISGESTTGTEEIRVTDAMVYPNPASDHITLNWSGTQERLSLEVYHITGALVIRQEVQPGQRLNIEQMRTGLYLYRLIDGAQTVQAGKLMKR
jgi:hypothetical protein